MSTTAMWLLLAVVVIAIVIGSVLYKRTFTTEELALTGVMAALSLVAYLFFRVPFYGGSSFHLGNTFTALTALSAGRCIRRSGRCHWSGAGRYPGR
ncbi:MAG: ECF transporter S component [Faecalibacterium sp.]